MTVHLKPQVRQVLAYLERHPEGMTQWDAIDLRNEHHEPTPCYRLAARIADLKAAGYAIDAELVHERGIRFSRYRLVREPVQLAAFTT